MDNHSHDSLKGKSVLITGGTGSFGRSLARRLLTDGQCQKVIIFSRDEWKQWEMRQSEPIFNHPNIRYFLGDVRDSNRLMRAFRDVNIVVHAAALKQVPAAEYNPSEFVNTNVMGAMNVIDQAINCNVEKVIALSTDKAVNPVNLYGATKLCSDRLFIAGNAYVGARNAPLFSVVRYGNVLDSRGSVIPVWKKSIANGATSLPITDSRMTRFWLTVGQSVQFVLDSIERMRGGEVYIPKLPSMRIEDLANALAPQLKHVYTGIREGEKIHEMLIDCDSARHTLEYHDHFMIVPSTIANDSVSYQRFVDGREGTQVPEEFYYASDTNSKWLSSADLQKLIENC